jgi:cytochrome c oxidase subunit I
MTWLRMPLTCWSWFVTAILILLAFGILLAAVVLLMLDRHAGTSFFIPGGLLVSGKAINHAGGSPLMWQHLFWFFGHPEVYIAILPAMGVTSHLLSVFARKPVFGYKAMVGATLAIGALGFMVWGHHMFVSGMNPYAGTAFALTTMAIAVPSTAKVFSWLGTLWGGGLQRKTPMLFSLGFLSLFIAGGVTGPILALPALDQYLHNTFFVVAHFHLIMGMAGAFSIFAGVYYWFPLMTGRLMSERLGRWHFWLSLIAVYGTFFPMHLEGLAGRPRHYAQVTGSTSSLASLLPMERGVTWAAFVLGAAQLIFLINLFWSARRGTPAGENPWRATTLEWQPNALSVTVERGPYEYHSGTTETGFTPQWETASQQE